VFSTSRSFKEATALAATLLAALAASALLLSGDDTATLSLEEPTARLVEADRDAQDVHASAALPNAASLETPAENEGSAKTREAPSNADTANVADTTASPPKAPRSMRKRIEAARSQVGRRGAGPAIAPGAPGEWRQGETPDYTLEERSSLDASALEVQDRRGTLVGRLEHAGINTIRGFAYDWRDPATPLEVELYRDDVLLQVVSASGARGAFQLPNPEGLDDGRQHRVRALARTRGGPLVELARSPRRVGGNALPEGRVVGIAEDRLVGWARDADADEEPVTVTLRLDGTESRTAVTGGSAPSGFEDHGHPGQWFSFELPAERPRALQAQVLVEDADVANLILECTNSPIEVPATPTALAGAEEETPPPNALPRGAVAFVSNTQITGWAVDADRGEAPIEVDVYFDGVFHERQRADGTFAALVHQSGIDSPEHLWLVTVPARLQDGETHVMSVFAVNEPEGTNPELRGSPATFTSMIDVAPTGFLDVANRNVIAGWTYDADAGSAPVEVEVWIDGAFWKVQRADSPRPDLVPVVCPEQEHGYRLSAPDVFADGAFHTVRVFARGLPGGGLTELRGSPKEIAALTPYLGLALESAPPGVRVTSVVAGSPAEAAGLAVNDELRQANGTPLTDDVQAFAQWIGSRVVGEVITLTVARPGESTPREVYPQLVASTSP
jgi:hypothetical protein